MLKETLKELLRILNKETGKTASDAALEMGYKKNYISEMLTPKGKVTDKFLNTFKLKYKEILDNPNWNLEEDEEEYLGKTYLENRFLKKKILDLENTLEKKDEVIAKLNQQLGALRTKLDVQVEKSDSIGLKKVGGK